MNEKLMSLWKKHLTIGGELVVKGITVKERSGILNGDTWQLYRATIQFKLVGIDKIYEKMTGWIGVHNNAYYTAPSKRIMELKEDDFTQHLTLDDAVVETLGAGGFPV